MSLIVDELPDQRRVMITPPACFDFSINSDLVAACSEYTVGQWRFTVDLYRVEYLDSTAVGMLLSLAGQAEEPVRVINIPSAVRTLLDSAETGSRIEMA